LLPDCITAHFFFLLAGFFGREITEGRSIYSLLSFGTTPGMFLECFLISSLFSAEETMIYAGFTHTTGLFAAPRQNGIAARQRARDDREAPRVSLRLGALFVSSTARR
jgi:hypothetical protein